MPGPHAHQLRLAPSSVGSARPVRFFPPVLLASRGCMVPWEGKRAGGSWFRPAHRRQIEGLREILPTLPHARARRFLARYAPTQGRASRGSLLVCGQPLFEFRDPYFETDKVLGKFASCARLHQFLYARPVTLSLGLCYLLCASGGYGIKVVHDNSLELQRFGRRFFATPLPPPVSWGPRSPPG